MPMEQDTTIIFWICPKKRLPFAPQVGVIRIKM